MFLFLLCQVNSFEIPPEYNKLEFAKNKKDYDVTDLSSLVDTVANEFHLERDRVEFFFGRCKWASSSKQLFSRMDMTQTDINTKFTYLGGTVIRVIKVGSIYVVRVRQITATTKYFSRLWVHLTGTQITNIFNWMYSSISNVIDYYKKYT